MLKKVNGDKNLGLDCFTHRFAQSCWDVFKLDLVKLF